MHRRRPIQPGFVKKNCDVGDENDLPFRSDASRYISLTMNITVMDVPGPACARRWRCDRVSFCHRAGALTELTFSNSMIEAWWRSLKQQWLFLHSLDSVTTVRRLVTFDVDEHNRVLPHSAFRGQTPDEMYVGTGDTVPADLTTRAAAARRARVESNRSAACETCPSVEAAA